MIAAMGTRRKCGASRLRKAAAQASVKGKGPAQFDTRGQTAAQHKEGGPLHKGAKGMKQLKKALQPSKAKQRKAGSAGSVDNKQAAAMLKMAKHAELAPSAAAKMPQPKPTSSPFKSPHRSLQGSESPARARGRPRSSTKANVAAKDIGMQAMKTETDIRHADFIQQQTPQQTQQQFLLPPLLLHTQQQQQHQLDLAYPPPVPAAEAQLLGKRKRSAPAVAVPEQPEQVLQAMHHNTALIVGSCMPGGRQFRRVKQAGTHRLPHIQPAQQIQLAAAQQVQHMTMTEQDQHTDSQAGPIQQTHAQPTQQAHEMTANFEPCNSSQDASAQLKSNGLWSNKRQRVNEATAEAAFTGKVTQQQARADA